MVEDAAFSAARSVIQDCKLALELLEEEIDSTKWRVHWVGALALLRAVGHILTKVDGEDEKNRILIDSSYKRWRENRDEYRIFWQFIEKERNNILKEYSFNVHLGDHVSVVYGEDLHDFGSDIYRPILDGYGVSEDARDIYQEALNWWEDEISLLEKERRNLS